MWGGGGGIEARTVAGAHLSGGLSLGGKRAGRGEGRPRRDPAGRQGGRGGSKGRRALQMAGRSRERGLRDAALPL